MTFGELRRAAKMTQEQAAELIEVDMTTIRRWESGQKQPRTKHLERMSEAYKCDLDTVYSAMNETYSRKGVTV